MKIIKKIIQWIASIPHDKLLHYTAGVIICSFFTALIAGIWQPSYGGICAGFGITLAIGIGKEIYDYYHRDTETSECLDAVFTIFGGFTASIINLLYLI